MLRDRLSWSPRGDYSTHYSTQHSTHYSTHELSPLSLRRRDGSDSTLAALTAAPYGPPEPARAQLYHPYSTRAQPARQTPGRRTDGQRSTERSAADSDMSPCDVSPRYEADTTRDVREASSRLHLSISNSGARTGNRIDNLHEERCYSEASHITHCPRCISSPRALVARPAPPRLQPSARRWTLRWTLSPRC